MAGRPRGRSDARPAIRPSHLPLRELHPGQHRRPGEDIRPGLAPAVRRVEPRPGNVALRVGRTRLRGPGHRRALLPDPAPHSPSRCVRNHSGISRSARGASLVAGCCSTGRSSTPMCGESSFPDSNGRSEPENASRSRNIGLEVGINARVTDGIELAGRLHLPGSPPAGLHLGGRRCYRHASVGGFRRQAPSGGPEAPAHRRGPGELPCLPWTSACRWSGRASCTWSPATRMRGPCTSGHRQARAWSRWIFAPCRRGRWFTSMPRWRLGPATLFGSVENLFGLRYAGTVLANEARGQFYEAGPPRWVSFGLKVTQWQSRPLRSRRLP